jgi:pyruvate/2-oxoglutarate dehydrogenase complex dihydrolipoamide dehydrogenase (E3) component
MADRKDHYDLISLGSGEAGKFIAWTYAAKHGKKCAVIERKWIGGACPNMACLPSKNFVHSANVAQYTRLAKQYGLGNYVSAGPFEVDMKEVKARKVRMVDGLVDMHMGRFKDFNVELVMGTGKFVGRRTIQVDGGRVLTADKIVICTGSRAIVDDKIPGLTDAKPLTHIEILDLDTLPKHLVIVGAGYVGLEFAQAFKRFGSEVTVIERHERPLKNEDADAVDALVKLLEKEGIKFLTSTEVSKIEGLSGEQVTVHTTSQPTITGTHILAAAGRTPNTEDIGLAEAGVTLTDKGFVTVDDQLRTAAEGVYAVGDCAGSPNFTHVAYDDFRVVLSHLTGSPRTNGTANRQIPSTLFTQPELAHVGLRESEANARGIKYRLAKLPMTAFLRAWTLDETEGFAKALGFTALGPSAGELLPVVQLAMKLGVGYGEIAELVITHPTMCEGLVYLFSAVPAAGA